MSEEDRLTILGPHIGEVSPGPTLVPLDHQVSPPRPGACPAPDFIGSGFRDAYALANAAGLRLSVSVWETTVGPWGRVLDQRPEPHARIRRGGRVVIVVSGRPQEQVPDVRALPLADAIERLAWLGFVPLIESRRSSCSVPAGHLVATRPSAGALLACGSVVALTVASAPRERSTPVVSDVRSRR